MAARSKVDAFLLLADECVALFHAMRAAAQQVHGQGEASAARRGILRSLASLGPQTVPQLARARHVSRQRIQSVVNGLLDDGLVTTAGNPAHRKSSLIELTPKGRKTQEAMAAKERGLAARLRLPDSAGMESAAETLRAARIELVNRLT